MAKGYRRFSIELNSGMFRRTSRVRATSKASPPRPASITRWRTTRSRSTTPASSSSIYCARKSRSRRRSTSPR